ncbi:TPA: deoxyuridine 5'-triphosphate nucleotidohydrolase [Clostridium botulinum]|nr:deoxyuridine 5'-triphosphate nucleotidohydrolase [Clostridium botulinum]
MLMSKKIKTVEVNELYFAKTKPNAIIPTKRDEDAGYDIYTCETETIVIEPNSTRLIDTGIAIACNKAYFPKFFDKGGMGSKGIIVGAGVGDSGFRDGYFVPLINTNKDKTLVITTQTKDEIEKCNYFNLDTKNFECISDDELVMSAEKDIKSGNLLLYFQITNYPFNINKYNNQRVVKKEDCIIKPIHKAITQFVMIPVPKFKKKEITWEELKSIKSERGLGKLGSSGK